MPGEDFSNGEGRKRRIAECTNKLIPFLQVHPPPCQIGSTKFESLVIRKEFVPLSINNVEQYQKCINSRSDVSNDKYTLNSFLTTWTFPLDASRVRMPYRSKMIVSHARSSSHVKSQRRVSFQGYFFFHFCFFRTWARFIPIGSACVREHKVSRD